MNNICNTPHRPQYFNPSPRNGIINNIDDRYIINYITPYQPPLISNNAIINAPIRRQLYTPIINGPHYNNVRRQLFPESDDEAEDVQEIIEEIDEEIPEDIPDNIHLDEGSPLILRQDESKKRSSRESLSNVSKVSTVEGETFTCSICLETSEDMSKEWSKVDKCNHIFHTSCLQEWCQIDKTCPNCRHKLL
jgi:hypothetical protein